MEELIAKAEGGDSVSQCKLAMHYMKDDARTKDVERALHWYKLAAQGGNSAAQYNLADMYMRGEGLPRNHERALYWFGQAADQGDLDALYNLGILHLGRGHGQDRLEADEPLSTRYFLLAAEGGLARAQYEAGVIFLHGRGVACDPEKARYWFVCALENGVARAGQQLDELEGDS